MDAREDKEFWNRMYKREVPDTERLENHASLVRFVRVLISQAQLLEQDPKSPLKLTSATRKLGSA